MRWLLWFQVLALLLALGNGGCGSSKPKERTCVGIDCGDHGHCEAGACLCDAGFQPREDGTFCDPFLPNLCQGITCSGLGSCAVIDEGFLGSRAECQCQAPAAPTKDLLDCIDVCAGVDCSPGTCKLSPDQQASCDCPEGYQPRSDSLGCVVKTSMLYKVVYLQDGQEYPLGSAFLTWRDTVQGRVLESTLQTFLPYSYDGKSGEGELLHTITRLGQDGQIAEVEVDEQPQFGTMVFRRRLHFTVTQGDIGQNVQFESTIQDQIWHGQIDGLASAPLPMGGATDYPTWARGCQDPLFYYLIGQVYPFTADPPPHLETILPNFSIPWSLQVTPSGTPDDGHITLDDFHIQADYSKGVLKQVSIDQGGGTFFRVIEISGEAPTEANFRPLPTTPIVHEVLPLPAVTEQAVSITSADGTALAGTLALPTGLPENLAVLMVPSLLPTDSNFTKFHFATYREIAANLAAGGFASLRFDDRGVGKSAGSSLDDPARQEEDLAAALDLLRADARFTGVVLLGYDFAVPRLLSLARATPVQGLVLLASTRQDLAADLNHMTLKSMSVAGMPQDVIDSFAQYYEGFYKGLRDGSDTNDFYGRSAAFWRTWLNADLLDPTGIQGPVLLLHGEEDIILPASNAQTVGEALTAAGIQVENHVLPGLSHAFTPGLIADLWEIGHLPARIDPQLVQLLLTWLRAR